MQWSSAFLRIFAASAEISWLSRVAAGSIRETEHRQPSRVPQRLPVEARSGLLDRRKQNARCRRYSRFQVGVRGLRVCEGVASADADLHGAAADDVEELVGHVLRHVVAGGVCLERGAVEVEGTLGCQLRGWERRDCAAGVAEA